VRWSQMQSGQPGLAALGRRRLLEPGVVLVATIRGDGTPRVSPVEPFIMDGDLWLSVKGSQDPRHGRRSAGVTSTWPCGARLSSRAEPTCKATRLPGQFSGASQSRGRTGWFRRL
jgi:hypothetical protein